MRSLLSVVAALAAAACSSLGVQGPMQRALDPSMERLVSTEIYIRDVAGISGDVSRIMRGDGYVYLVDVGPTMRHVALIGDTLSYRRLRRFVDTSLMARDAAGAQPRRRVRGASPFEPATPYAVRRLGDALSLGWQRFGDTASAVLAASLRPVETMDRSGSATDQLVERCTMAEVAGRVDKTAARRVLASAKSFRNSVAVTQVGSIDLRGGDADLSALACLTRLGLALKDPDATVRFLDRLLSRLQPYTRGSGRPDPGAAADVLLVLREAREQGPAFYKGR